MGARTPHRIGRSQLYLGQPIAHAKLLVHVGGAILTSSGISEKVRKIKLKTNDIRHRLETLS